MKNSLNNLSLQAIKIIKRTLSEYGTDLQFNLQVVEEQGRTSIVIWGSHEALNWASNDKYKSKVRIQSIKIASQAVRSPLLLLKGIILYLREYKRLQLIP